ncbi:MAG TPA: hypothetical protein VKZ53_31465 [Candidatus Angelobacter sp.]|nr:hypothetical protein [Candidatus Angelobacter sp.]
MPSLCFRYSSRLLSWPVFSVWGVWVLVGCFLTASLCVAKDGFVKDASAQAGPAQDQKGSPSKPTSNQPTSLQSRAIPASVQLLLDRWLTEHSHPQLAWKTDLFPYQLSNHQRFRQRIEIAVPERELKKRPGERRLLALIRVTDRDGKSLMDDGVLITDVTKLGQHVSGAVFGWTVFLLPGEYTVTLALYDRISKEHNVIQHKLKVAPFKHDPLPEAWRDLPNIEFLESGEDEADSLFHPEVSSRLYLPLATDRPVQIELLANLTPSEAFTGSNRMYRFNLRAMIPILKTFSQIDVANGTLNLATLNLTRREANFRQDDSKSMLDWPKLKAALEDENPGVVGVQDLQARKRNAAFLRESLARWIAAGEEKSADVGNPLRVFILISSPVLFNFKEGLKEIELPRICDCLVYHLRYDWLFRGASFDDLDRTLKPLKLRTFSANSPEGVRKALADILQEIAQKSAAGEGRSASTRLQ